MNKTTYGTNHFVSLTSAMNYYSAQGYGYTSQHVQQKIKLGEIAIGEPRLIKPKQKLLINQTEGRYFIEQSN